MRLRADVEVALGIVMLVGVQTSDCSLKLHSDGLRSGSWHVLRAHHRHSLLERHDDEVPFEKVTAGFDFTIFCNV